MMRCEFCAVNPTLLEFFGKALSVPLGIPVAVLVQLSVYPTCIYGVNVIIDSISIVATLKTISRYAYSAAWVTSAIVFVP